MIFGKKSKEEEREDIEVEEIPYNLIIRVKFRPKQSHRWTIAEDVEPPPELVEDLLLSDDREVIKSAEEELLAWLREEYGGGEWKIELHDGRRVVKSRTIKIKDEPIRYGVSRWNVFVKGLTSNRWYKADVDFDHYPSIAEILDAVEGGGSIRIVAYDDSGRVVDSKVMSIDAPPPEWLKERENTLEKQIRDAIAERQKKEAEKLIKKIGGTVVERVEGEAEEAEKDKFDELFEKMEKFVDDKRLKVLEEFLEKLNTGGDRKSLSDMLFTEPYKVKLDATRMMIEELVKAGRVDEAKELLREIPDGTGALINLLSAGANLANAIAMAFAGAGRGFVDYQTAKREMEREIERRKKAKVKKERVEKKEEEEKVEAEEEKKEVMGIEEIMEEEEPKAERESELEAEVEKEAEKEIEEEETVGEEIGITEEELLEGIGLDIEEREDGWTVDFGGGREEEEEEEGSINKGD